MGFEDEEEESVFFQRKWIIVSVIVVILLISGTTLFVKFIPDGFFSRGESNGLNTNPSERQFTLTGDSGTADGNSTGTSNTGVPNTPSKIGSVTVSAGSMGYVEIKG